MKKISYKFILKFLSIFAILSALLFLWLQMFHLRLNRDWYDFCRKVPVDQAYYNSASQECERETYPGQSAKEFMAARIAENDCMESKNIAMKKECSFPDFFLPAK